MATALITNYLAPYRLPLYELLAERDGLEVLCFGGGERYVPSWFADLDAQLASARFPARRLRGPAEAFSAAGRYDTVIAPFAGGAMLPAAYAGARRRGRGFVLWASVWAEPRSAAHLLALPVSRHIYRHADAVVAYGEHVRRFVGRIRGRVDDVLVAPQAVEPQLFDPPVSQAQVSAFRAEHQLPEGPLVLYVGRLVPEKGVAQLLEASAGLAATLVLVGDGPLAAAAALAPGVRWLGPLPRERLPVAYAAAAVSVLASVASPRFREPWGLVINEAMHQSCAVVASEAVGAVAGGLVRDGETGIVVPAADAPALRAALERLLADDQLRQRLGQAGRRAVTAYTPEAMAAAFRWALDLAASRR